MFRFCFSVAELTLSWACLGNRVEFERPNNKYRFPVQLSMAKDKAPAAVASASVPPPLAVGASAKAPAPVPPVPPKPPPASASALALDLDFNDEDILVPPPPPEATSQETGVVPTVPKAKGRAKARTKKGFKHCTACDTTHAEAAFSENQTVCMEAKKKLDCIFKAAKRQGAGEWFAEARKDEKRTRAMVKHYTDLQKLSLIHI